jgi:hypothetical protein
LKSVSVRSADQEGQWLRLINHLGRPCIPRWVFGSNSGGNSR